MINLYHGDCLEVMKQIPDKSIDCIITDPPYFFNPKNNGGGKFFENRKYASEILTKLGSKNSLDVGITDDFLEETKRLFKVGYNGIFFCNQEQLEQYLRFARKNNFRFIITMWHKTNPAPLTNNKYLDDIEFAIVIRTAEHKIQTHDYHKLSKVYTSVINKKDKQLYGHPTIKPLELIYKYVNIHTKENDVVLDPFMGSGTTGVACKHLNRNFIGIELDNKYFDIAEKRINGELL